MKIKSQNENKRLDSSLEANYNTSKGGSQLANRKEENMSIVEARMRRGLSQRDMADLLHLPYSTYNEYETGRKTVPAEIATKISLLANRRARKSVKIIKILHEVLIVNKRLEEVEAEGKIIPALGKTVADVRREYSKSILYFLDENDWPVKFVVTLSTLVKNLKVLLDGEIVYVYLIEREG